MDRGAWRATVYSVAKSQTRLKRLSGSSPGLEPGSPPPPRPLLSGETPRSPGL